MENNNDETDIYCPICHSFFDASVHLPRMLPECGHTLCNQCIISSLEKSDSISCLEDHIVSHGKEVTSFPKNFCLLHIIERKQKQNQSKIPTNPSSSSSLHSHTLKKSICSLKQSLETVGSCEIRNQGSQDFQDTENESRQYCVLHRKERDIVCFQCKEQICSNCALFGSHKKHDIRNLEEAKEVIFKQANLIFSVVEQVEQKISFLKSEEISKMLETALRDNLRQEIENVSQTFKEIVDAINEKQKQIKEELTNTLEDSLRQLKGIVKQPMTSIISSEKWIDGTSQDLSYLGEMSKKHELFTSLLIEGTPETLQQGHKELNQLDQIKNSLIENTIALSIKAASVNQSLKLKEFAASIAQVKLKEIQSTKVIQKDKLLQQFEAESQKAIASQSNAAEQLSQIKREVEEFYTKHSNSPFQVFSVRSSVSSQELKIQHQGKNESKSQKVSQTEKDTKSNQQQILPFNQVLPSQESQLSSNQPQQPNNEVEQLTSNKVAPKEEIKTITQTETQEKNNQNNQIGLESTKDTGNVQTPQTEKSEEARPALLNNFEKSNENDQKVSQQQEVPKLSCNINSNASEMMTNGISKQDNIKKQDNPQALGKQQSNTTPQTSKSKQGSIDFSNLPDFTKESLLLNQSLAVNSILCDGLSFFSQKEEHDLSGKKHVHKLNIGTKLVYSEEEDNNQENEKEEEDDDENLVSQITNKDALLSQLFSNPKFQVDDRNLLEESFSLHSPQHKQVSLRKEQQNSVSANTEYPSHFFAVISGILNNSVDSADFSHMDIMDKGLEAVAFAMSENSSLHQINLDRNKITDVGCIKLFETLDAAQLNLESLNLNNNLITDKCLTALLALKPKQEKKTLKIFLANNLINASKQATTIKQIQDKCGIIIHT